MTNAAGLLREARRWMGGILLVLAAGSLLFGLGPVLYGVIAGGLVGWLNIEVIIRLTGRIVQASEQQRLILVALLPLKLLFVGALIYVLVTVVGVSAPGFLAGVAGALLGLVVASKRPRAEGCAEDRSRQAPE